MQQVETGQARDGELGGVLFLPQVAPVEGGRQEASGLHVGDGFLGWEDGEPGEEICGHCRYLYFDPRFAHQPGGEGGAGEPFGQG